MDKADIEPYRFEPERRVVDDSSSTENADSTQNLDGDDRRGSTEDGEREWATRSGVAVERVVSCLPVKNVFVDKEWTNYRLDVAWFTLHHSARRFCFCVPKWRGASHSGGGNG